MAQGVAEPAWTAADEARLAELWARPELSESAIAKLLGRSRPSVDGKRRRLLLPARPSPIRPKAPGAPPAVELTPAQRARREAGLGGALPAGHPIALAVLAEAGIRFRPGTWDLAHG